MCMCVLACMCVLLWVVLPVSTTLHCCSQNRDFEIMSLGGEYRTKPSYNANAMLIDLALGFVLCCCYCFFFSFAITRNVRCESLQRGIGFGIWYLVLLVSKCVYYARILLHH